MGKKKKKEREKSKLYGALNSQLDSDWLKWGALIYFILCTDDSLHNHIPFGKRYFNGNYSVILHYLLLHRQKGEKICITGLKA